MPRLVALAGLLLSLSTLPAAAQPRAWHPASGDAPAAVAALERGLAGLAQAGRDGRAERFLAELAPSELGLTEQELGRAGREWLRHALSALEAAPQRAGPAGSPRLDLSRIDLSQLGLAQLDLSSLDLSQLDLSQLDLSGLDPAVLAAGAGDTLMRAPDSAIDALFQAVRQAARTPSEAGSLCALFDPGADRSPQALAAAAQRLGPDSQQRFAAALLGIAATGLQSPLQPFDASAAKQTLKSAAATAMLLHDGFGAGLNNEGRDPAAREARCRSLGWLLDAVAEQPLERRAAATRLMLKEGLERLGPR